MRTNRPPNRSFLPFSNSQCPVYIRFGKRPSHTALYNAVVYLRIRRRLRYIRVRQCHRCICAEQTIAYIREGAANIAAPNLYHFDQYKLIFFGPQLQNPHRVFFCRTVYLYVSTGLKPAPNPQGYLLHSHSLRLTESIPA